MSEKASELISRLNDYFEVGGTWNPEMMEHDKVQRLLCDLREHLLSPRPSEREHCPVIVPTAECNIGSDPVFIHQATNAIWNKLNVTLSLLSEDTKKQATDCIKEARELADLIVNYPHWRSDERGKEMVHNIKLSSAREVVSECKEALEGEMEGGDVKYSATVSSAIRLADQFLKNSLK